MSGYNKCVFLGNLGSDPETRTFAGGKTVCNFRIAVNERKDGEPLWLNVSAFERLGETCQKNLSKGRQVLVDGRLQVRKYEKDGVERTAVEVIASSVTFVGAKGERGADAGDPVERVKSKFGFGGGDDSGDVPF